MYRTLAPAILLLGAGVLHAQTTLPDCTITIGSSGSVSIGAGACGFSISPASVSLPSAAYTGTVSVVTTQQSSDANPASSVPWITITSGAGAAGNASIGYSVQANTSSIARSGAITVGNQVLSVSQAGATCSYSASPSTVPIAATGGSGTIYVTPGKTVTEMKVEYLGVASPGVQLDVAASAPAIFTMDASGQGAGAILNQDYSVNSAAKPAAKNSVVMIFATGDGDTNPGGSDGRVTPNDATQLARTKLNVTATIGGINAPVTYSGGAPGLVAGVVQINVRVPSNAPTSNSVPVVIKIGNAQTQANVTLAVR